MSLPDHIIITQIIAQKCPVWQKLIKQEPQYMEGIKFQL